MKIKKSFVLYHDLWECFKLLTDEELGRLIRAVFVYERERAEPKNLDSRLEIAFAVIKEMLDRDRKKYEQVCMKNKETAEKRWKKIRDSCADIQNKTVNEAEPICRN